MRVKPSRQPSTARHVCSGLRQVHTFIVSTMSTTSRVAKMTPARSSGGRPLGNASSMTRYCASSALTNGATNERRPVTRTPMSARPSASSISRTESSGRGVILSIMLHGKDTRARSCT